MLVLSGLYGSILGRLFYGFGIVRFGNCLWCCVVVGCFMGVNLNVVDGFCGVVDDECIVVFLWELSVE